MDSEAMASKLQEFLAYLPTDGAGDFYHGSPNVNISEFRTRIERPDGYSTAGVFFTHSPIIAAWFASRNGSGRIYSAELVAEKPFFVSAGDEWERRLAARTDRADLRRIETELIRETAANGHDLVVTSYLEDAYLEVIALADEVIRRTDQDIPRLPEWGSSRSLEALTFYEADGLGGPDYAPNCTRLYGDRRTAAETGRDIRRVVVNPRNPIYCERRVWPQMNFQALAEITQIDCLVDPRGGGALVLDPDKIHAVSRVKMRALQAELRRKPRRAA